MPHGKLLSFPLFMIGIRAVDSGQNRHEIGTVPSYIIKLHMTIPMAKNRKLSA